MFVPHSNNNANLYHTYTKVKKNYMLKVSMTLGEFGPDIKEALKAESDLLLKQPTRKMITLPLGVTDPGALDPKETTSRLVPSQHGSKCTKLQSRCTRLQLRIRNSNKRRKT